MNKGLSARTIAAIAELATPPVRVEDVRAALHAYALDRPSWLPALNLDFLTDSSELAKSALRRLDLSDPETVTRVIGFASRLARLYEAGAKHRGDRLVRMQNCLSDDGYTLEVPGDPLAAITRLAATAQAALPDAAAIRLELIRLERALPDDPGVAIGRAKNLIEATCKAALQLRGELVDEREDLPALVYRTLTSLGLHATQATGPYSGQIRRVVGKLPSLAQDISELRNRAGDGHGFGSFAPEADGASARLAARSAVAWCSFVLEVVQGKQATAATAPQRVINASEPKVTRVRSD